MTTTAAKSKIAGSFAWLDRERTTILEQTVYVTPTRRFVFAGPIKRHPMGEQPERNAATPNGRSCGSKVVPWLGVRWYGKPAPLRRLRVRSRWWTLAELRRPWWPLGLHPEPGCGCLVKGKAVVRAIKNGIQTIRTA